MFPQHAELQSLYNTIFNEISHLVGSQQKFMNQSFLLIYYTYLVLCHRKARGAPMPEINRYNGIVGKYQIEILKNYAAAKKGVVSSSESFFKDLVTKNYGQLGISEIEEEPNRVMECGSMNFLLLPAAKVAGMIEKQQSLKDFPTKCLLVPYSIDILADDYAFEINGPFHYARDCITQKFHLNGHTKLKKEFIQSLGLKYVEVPFWVIDEMITIDDKDKLAKVKELLQTDVNGSDK